MYLHREGRDKTFGILNIRKKRTLWVPKPQMQAVAYTYRENVLTSQKSEKNAHRGYRFLYNGKEIDNEGIGGGGCTYDYGFRIYNPQIARFLSVDPLAPSYPWYTPYQFAGNMPIWCIDIDGLEDARATRKYTVEIWHNQKKMPDGTTVRVGFVNYTAGTTITEQGDEGGPVMNNIIRVNPFNIHAVSGQWVVESPIPTIKHADVTQVEQTTQTNQSTANNEVPPTPDNIDSDNRNRGGQKIFGRETPQSGDKPMWIKGNATFNGNAWDITNPSDVKRVLAPIAEALKSDPDLKVTIYGNTANPNNPWGAPTSVPGVTNSQIALNRANAVKKMLENDFGVNPQQVTTGKAANPGGGTSANYEIKNTK